MASGLSTGRNTRDNRTWKRDNCLLLIQGQGEIKRNRPQMFCRSSGQMHAAAAAAAAAEAAAAEANNGGATAAAAAAA